MKKITSLLIAALIGVGTVSAQSLKLKVNDTEVTEGATIKFEGEYDGFMGLTCYIQISNTSDKDVDVKLEFSQEGLPEEASAMICGFGQCSVLPYVEGTIAAGAVEGDNHDRPMDLAYTPNDKLDAFVASCTLTNKTDNETLKFKIHFIPTNEGAANQTVAEVIAAAYPNPASEVVNFRLNNVKAGATVVLRDLSGKALRQVAAADEVSMNLQGLSAGMYFYTVEEKGVRMATGKLVIR